MNVAELRLIDELLTDMARERDCLLAEAESAEERQQIRREWAREAGPLLDLREQLRRERVR